jgi:23S rRNA (guanosine2251-2'-O)-methyltransferase
VREAKSAGVRVIMGKEKNRGRERGETPVSAECADFEYTPIEDIIENALSHGAGAHVVALDHVQDPHNLGAILRTAAAAGVQGVIIQKQRCCPVTAAVYEVSSGGAQHVPVARVPNLPRALEQLKQAGFWTAGADAEGGRPLWEAGLNVPLAWVLGAEGRGLQRLVRERCDFLVRIPAHERFATLNVSVAAAVLMFEARRVKSLSSDI